MKTTYFIFGLTLLVLSKLAHADGSDITVKGDTPIFSGSAGNQETGILLVEETNDGSKGETLLVQAAHTENGTGYRITKAVTIEGPSPFLSIGGRVGVETESRAVEAGIEGFVFYFPPRDGAGGVAGGAYINVAPIPGKWGRRFYLHGKAYAAYGFGHPTYHALSFGAALGYRQPLDAAGLGDDHGAGKPRYLFFEIGAEQSYLLKYNETVYMLDVLKAGLVW